MGWQYQLVDWQWYGNPLRRTVLLIADADLTKMNPDINIPGFGGICSKENIKIILWLLWANVNKQMEEAFAQYENGAWPG